MELPSKDKSQLETVVLHPNGGSALIVGNKRFVVSRDILKVTSDYFKTLFDPSKFKEGRDRNIDILLHEDDPEAMEIMLSILHYRHQESYNQLSPEMLLKVAQHCDKYLCTERMQPRAFRWMQHISEDESIQYYENLSKVAHLFKSVDCLIAISTVAIRSLPPHFGAANTEDEIDGLLFPFHEGSSYRIEIDMEIKNRRAEIGQLLESTTTILRNTSSVNSILDKDPLCLRCIITTSRGSMECQWCGSSNLSPRMCTNITRVSEYRKLIESVSLVPTEDYFYECSLSRLAKDCGELDGRLKHICSANQSCPLRQQLQEIGKRAQSIVYSKATLFEHYLYT